MCRLSPPPPPQLVIPFKYQRQLVFKCLTFFFKWKNNGSWKFFTNALRNPNCSYGQAKLFQVVTTSDYSVFAHIIFTLPFLVCPYVGKYWDLSEKSWWVAVTKAAYLIFFCGFGCQARISTDDWNDQGLLIDCPICRLKASGSPPWHEHVAGW